MSTKNEAVQGLISTATDLGIILICPRLYKGEPIFSGFCDVMLKASEENNIVFICLAAGLQMVRRSGKTFNTKQVA